MMKFNYKGKEYQIEDPTIEMWSKLVLIQDWTEEKEFVSTRDFFFVPCFCFTLDSKFLTRFASAHVPISKCDTFVILFYAFLFMTRTAYFCFKDLVFF